MRNRNSVFSLKTENDTKVRPTDYFKVIISACLKSRILPLLENKIQSCKPNRSFSTCSNWWLFRISTWIHLSGNPILLLRWLPFQRRPALIGNWLKVTKRKSIRETESASKCSWLLSGNRSWTNKRFKQNVLRKNLTTIFPEKCLKTTIVFKNAQTIFFCLKFCDRRGRKLTL